MKIAQQDLDLLQALTDIPSVSGHEDEIIDFVRRTVSVYGFDTSVDGVGNVLVKVAGRDSDTRLMIFSHLDELGLCVKTITDDGYIKVDRIGGINRKSLSGCPVLVHTETSGSVPGSVGVMSHHKMAPGEYLTAPDIPELYVDVGASSLAEAEAMGIQVGNPITYVNFFAPIGEHAVRARALDNKAGCFILLKLLQSLAETPPAVDTYIVFSVQEEFNVRGVLPAARVINPTAAICVDGGITGDTPDLKGVSRTRFGGGIVVGQMSFHGRGTLGGLIPNPKLKNFVEQTAAAAGISFTRQASIGGLSDASFLQLLNAGIPALDLGFPMRYSHSPIEMVDFRDLYTMVSLLQAVTAKFDAGVDLKRGSI